MNLSNTFQVLQKTKSLDLNGRVIDTNNYHSMTATYMPGVILSIWANIRSLVPPLDSYTLLYLISQHLSLEKLHPAHL